MYRTFTRIQAVIAGLALLALAVLVMAQPPKWTDKSEATIVQSAVSLSGGIADYDDNGNDFDILVAAVVATGYLNDPLSGEYDYTVFAPSDEAFLALAGYPVDTSGNGSSEDEAVGILVGLLGLDGIRDVLDYHVTEGVRNSVSVTKARMIKMLDGNTISARGGYVEAVGSDADFVDTDIRVADGMIHVIDAVLLPFVP